MKKKVRMSLAAVLSVLMLLTLLAGCGTTTTSPTPTAAPATTAPVTSPTTTDTSSPADTTSPSATPNPNGPIVVDFPMYVTGSTVNGGAAYDAMVARFNAQYAGQYQINIQPVVQADYDNKIKTLQAAGQLPTLMYTMNDTTWVSGFIAQNNLSYDFGPWLAQHPEIANLLIPESLQFCTTSDGRVYCLPMLTTSPIGMFVNSAVYNPSTPIASQTFDSLQQDLTSANQKIAFMTGENAWSTMLWFSAIINSIPGGTALMQQYGGMTGQYVTDFSNPIWLQATTELQSYLQKNSTSNAIGATAADMLNTFMNNNAAIMPNGPWMMSQFDGTDKSNWGPNFDGSTVTSSAYPGNIMLGSDYTIGQYWISASASPDQIQAALAFIQFVYSGPELEMRMLAEGNWCPNYTPSANFWTQVASDPPLASYFKATQNVGTVGPRFDECCYGSVVSANGGDFANLLPDLITGKSTPQQFLDQLQAAEVAAQTAAGS